MSHVNQISFTFDFLAHPELPAHVVKFSGQAHLNRLYNLSVATLVPTKELANAQWSDFFGTPIRLTLRDDPGRGQGAQAGETTWTGLLSRMSAGARVGEFTWLELELTPSLGLLAGQIQNRVHLGLNCLDILKDSFQFGGLQADRFRFQAQANNYAPREFVFQYEQDLLDFVWRTLQFDGLGLYYEPGPEFEVAVITDANAHFPVLMDGDQELVLNSVASSGLLTGENRPAFDFRVASSWPPKSLLLNDYNWEDPNRPLTVRLEVSPQGRGEAHLYGENFTTKEEGLRLAGIRREEILAGAELFHLTTKVVGFRPGVTFTLANHPWGGFNQRYLTVGTEFFGSQTGLLSSKLGLDLGREDLTFSHNLTCLSLDRPYRPQANGPRKKIAGSLTAWIDGAGSGDAPEVDKYGRYKILLPMDVSGRGAGKASAWIRMAQPYVGNGYGQNFPLTPGAEVLLTFIDGNPDRPVISGALANAENISLVNAVNPHMSGLGTRGGSGLIFDERAGSQKIVMNSGSNRGTIALRSSSPSDALIQADSLSLMNYSAVTSTAGKNSNVVGKEFSLNVEEDTYLKSMIGLQALKDSYNEAVSWWNNADDNDSPLKPAATAQKVGQIADVAAGLASKSVTTVSAFSALKSSLLLPHSNIVTLKATPKGAKTVMRAKKTTNYNVVNWCLLYGELVKVVKNVDDILRDEKDKDDYENQTGAYAKGDAPTDGKKLAKRLSVWIAEGSKAADILAKILGDVALFMAMTKPFGEPKGLVVENTDSYVAIQAKQSGTLSTSGPAIVESASALVGEMGRYGVSDNLRPKELLTPDVTVLTSAIDYDQSKAVVARADDLVRLRADEVNLQAYKAIAARTPGPVQIFAGASVATKAKLTARQALLASLVRNNKTLADLSETDELYLPTKAESLAQQVLLLADGFPGEAEKTFLNGVLIRSEGSGDKIVIQTAEKNSEIAIQQGEGSITAGDQSRQIKLTGENTTIQEDDKVQLKLVKDDSATLKMSDDLGLFMKSTEVKLALSDSNNLQLSNDGVNIKGSAFKVAAGDGGQVSITADASGLKISFGGHNVNITAAGCAID
ncbi:MAG: type VI secretion system Vgr family protein [Deltaproteobacteria bacterium]|jgi:type VI secretion system VgrG family protein|nr:type VI secretion system Vgr family protein [Deltaproteobacteria bacterium]